MANALKSLWGGVRSVADISSHLHTLSSIFGTFSGKGVDKDSPTGAKGISGVSGLRDEREWLNLLTRAERKVPGSAQIISDFVRWHFRFGQPEPSLAVKWYIKLRSNQFRATIIDMAKTEPRDSGEITHIVDTKLPDGGTVKSTLNHKLREDGIHSGLDLILHMYEIITEGTKEGVKKPSMRGYRKCLDYLRSAGVPTLVDSTMDLYRRKPAEFEADIRATAPQALKLYKKKRRRVIAAYKEAAKSVGEQANQFEKYVSDYEKRPGWQKFIESIFGQ